MDTKDYVDVAAAVGTCLSAAFAGWAALEASKVSKASRSQLVLSKRQLAVSQRAWLSANVLLDGTIGFHQTGCSIPVIARIKNFGASPGHEAKTTMEVCFDLNSAPEQLKALVNQCRREHNITRGGRLVIPGEEYDRPWFLDADSNEIETQEKKGGIFPILVLGCVAYNIVDDDAPHCTGFVYLIDSYRQVKTWEGGFAD
jgi:hypothetical protein